MRFDIMTLFPEVMQAVLDSSIIGRAQKKGVISIDYHNIRDYTLNRQRQVDDYPYGGGQGVVMACQPIYDCFNAIANGKAAGQKNISYDEVIDEKPYTVYLSPKGKVFNQQKAAELSKKKWIVLLCGHYEGVDQRVLDEIVDEEISIGDYVLTGGEIGACAVVDAVSRMVNGVLSDDVCFTDESHFSGLLEYPQFTRPAVYFGQEVPEVLQNGHHANIEKYKHTQSLLVTLQKRPDLLLKYPLTDDDKRIILDYIANDKSKISHLTANQRSTLTKKLTFSPKNNAKSGKVSK